MFFNLSFFKEMADEITEEIKINIMHIRAYAILTMNDAFFVILKDLS